MNLRMKTKKIMTKICEGEKKKNTRTVDLTSSDFASVIDLLSLGGSWMCLLRPPPTRGRTLQNTLMLPCFIQRKESDK